MKKATIFIKYNEGHYLGSAKAFEESLLNEFLRVGKYDSPERFKWYMVLKDHIEKQENNKYPQDVLDNAFIDTVTVDHEFAVMLNLFDVVSPKCFTGDGEIGDAIIELCYHADLLFIVTKKRYNRKDNLEIDFEVCHYDNEDECLRALIRQEI